MKEYIPPFNLTNKMTNLVYEIAQLISELKFVDSSSRYPRLKRINQLRSVRSSIAIENNSLTLNQVTDVIDGKKVLAPHSEILEAKNCFLAYEYLDKINPYSIDDLLKVHKYMTHGLCEQSGHFRTTSVGVFSGSVPVHIAPPHNRVYELINNLLIWLKTTKTNFIIASCVFHFEFEFIHPFIDGNGRMGRLWQTAYLSKHLPVFKYLPIEETIFDNRPEYYNALRIGQKDGHCTYFVEFMLEMILKSLKKMKKEFNSFEYDSKQLTDLMKVITLEPKSSSELMKLLKLKNQPNFYYNYLKPAVESGLIKMTNPNKPTSKNQKYYK